MWWWWWYPIIASFVLYWAVRGITYGFPFALRLWRIPQNLVADRPQKLDAVKIGILGASNIAKFAVLWPAVKDTAVRVVAVGSRSLQKAEKYAKRNGIEKAYGSYQEVLDDPNVEAIYIGLPTEYHYIWTMRSIEAGKHVLVEKPITVNHREAANVLNLLEGKIRNRKNSEEAAHYKSLVVLEGYHWRFHPVARHIKRVLEDRKFLGRIRVITMQFSLVDLKAWSIDFFAGPTRSNSASLKHKIKLLDRWCYAIDTIRFSLPKGAKLVVDSAKLTTYRAEASMTATYTESEDKENVSEPGRMKSWDIAVRFVVDKSKMEIPSWNLKVAGSLNEVSVTNIGHPYIYHSVQVGSITDKKGKASFQMYGNGETTFEHQLSAFAAAIRNSQPNGVKGRLGDNKRGVAGDEEIWPTLSSAVENMKLVDKILMKGGEKSLSGRHWQDEKAQ